MRGGRPPRRLSHTHTHICISISLYRLVLGSLDPSVSLFPSLQHSRRPTNGIINNTFMLISPVLW